MPLDGGVTFLVRDPAAPKRNFFATPSVSYIAGGNRMYCNYCGKVIQDDANLCAYCGTRVGGVIGRKRLVRSRANRKIAGVCAGFAEYFDLDVTLVRVVWLVLLLIPPCLGLLSYLIAWIVMPEEPEMHPVPAGQQQVTNLS